MPTGPLVLYDNRLRDAVPAASSTAAGYDVLNTRDLREYTWWKPAALPATITVDCGGVKNADSSAIYAHNLGSSGCTVEVRKSNDNFAANDVLVDTFAPGDDKPILRLFALTGSRYWRYRFLNGVPPTLAIALLGSKLEIPVPMQRFDPLGYALRGQTNRSVLGRALGRVIDYREWKETFTFENLTWAWVRANWQPAAQAWLDSEPFLFSWNPDAYPKETYHVVIGDEGWRTQHKPGSFCDLQLPLSGVMPV